jgi:hypothetical protein
VFRKRPARRPDLLTVTFRSRRTGQELACFERQTRAQAERLLASPPVASHLSVDASVVPA